MRRKFYPTIKQTFGESEVNPFSSCHFFDGTLTYTDTDEKGQTVTLHYPDIGFAAKDLKRYWLNYFEERRLATGAYIGPWTSDEEFNNTIKAIAGKTKDRIEDFIKANQYKYLTLVKTLGFEYDPISNYGMIEKRLSTQGAQDITSGPNTDVATPEGTDYTIEGNSVAVSNVTGDGRSVVVSNWDRSTGDGSTTTNTLQTAHYTTTYDDASGTRLESRDINGGSPAIVTTTVVPTASITKHLSEATKTTQGERTDNYILTRNGNIGVMSTQDMIKQEREVALINIIDMFFEELNEKVLLGTWN